MVGLAGAGAISVSVFAHDPIGSTTWTRDIEPLVRARCTPCHSTEGPAVPRLTGYQEVRANAEAVKAAVVSRRMPIWGAVRGLARFANDPSLSPYQISLIASWVESRTPEGPTSNKTTASPHGPEPDLQGRTLDIELPFLDGGTIRKTVAIPAEAGIRAWRLERREPGLKELRITEPSGRVLAVWAPDSPGETMPSGTGWFPRAATIVASGTRNPSDVIPGVPASGSSLVRVWLTNRSARALELVSIPCGSASTIGGRIHAFRPSSPRPAAVGIAVGDTSARRLAAFEPTTYRDDRAYWLREPVELPRGSRLLANGANCTVDLMVTDLTRPAAIP